jgi:hypothetical protein
MRSRVPIISMRYDHSLGEALTEGQGLRARDRGVNKAGGAVDVDVAPCAIANEVCRVFFEGAQRPKKGGALLLSKGRPPSGLSLTELS